MARPFVKTPDFLTQKGKMLYGKYKDNCNTKPENFEEEVRKEQAWLELVFKQKQQKQQLFRGREENKSCLEQLETKVKVKRDRASPGGRGSHSLYETVAISNGTHAQTSVQLLRILLTSLSPTSRWWLGSTLLGLKPSLSHEAAKPWVGCWLPGSRTTLLVAPVSYTLGPEAGWRVAGRTGPEASLRLAYFETSLRLRRRG